MQGILAFSSSEIDLAFDFALAFAFGGNFGAGIPGVSAFGGAGGAAKPLGTAEEGVVGGFGGGGIASAFAAPPSGFFAESAREPSMDRTFASSRSCTSTSWILDLAPKEIEIPSCGTGTRLSDILYIPLQLPEVFDPMKEPFTHQPCVRPLSNWNGPKNLANPLCEVTKILD